MERQKIHFSVVVPAYNLADHITACLESLTASISATPGLRAEFLVVDDASSDGTIDAVKRFDAEKGGGRIRLVELPVNLGLSGARNAGLEIAKGEYVTLVDGDDRVEANYFPMLRKCVSADAPDVVTFSAVNHYPDGRTSLVVKQRPNFQGDGPGLLLGWLVDGVESFHCWRHCYRRDFLEANGFRFDVDLRLLEDVPWTLKCLLAARRAMYIDTPLYRYQFRADSLINADTPERRWREIKAIPLVIKSISQFIAGRETSPELLRRLRAFSVHLCFAAFHRIQRLPAYRERAAAYEYLAKARIPEFLRANARDLPDRERRRAFKRGFLIDWCAWWSKLLRLGGIT